MSVYRVTVPVTFVVEINDENVQAAPRPALRGDSPLVAVRRAIWCLLARDRPGQQKVLGVKKLLIKGHWENFEAAELKLEFASRPFAPDALAPKNEAILTEKP